MNQCASNVTSILAAARVHWRLVAILLLLTLAVIIPFALWGENLEQWVQLQLTGAPNPRWIAVAGFALLVLDVLLPVPSSIVSMTLCLVLGPLIGSAVVLAGMVCAFLLGYALGAMLPEEKLRGWVGERSWRGFYRGISSQSLLWLAATRPVPILAEVTAVMAGVARVPLVRTLPHVILSSALVSLAYGLAAVAGLAAAETSQSLLVLVSAVLPCVFWFAYRFLKRQASP